jgi:hypothetical protein
MAGKSDLYTFVAGCALEGGNPFQLECNCGGVIRRVGQASNSMSALAAQQFRRRRGTADMNSNIRPTRVGMHAETTC